MTDLERAADIVARCIPIGFSNPQDNQRCCNIIDSLAAEILRMDSNSDLEGLAALVIRQQKRLEQLSFELSRLRDEVSILKAKLVMGEAKDLLQEL